MALIQCPDCGKQISDSISTCIHCGAELRLCPDCHAPLTANDKTCPGCGCALGEGNAPMPTDATAEASPSAEEPRALQEIVKEFFDKNTGFKRYRKIKNNILGIVFFGTAIIAGIILAIIVGVIFGNSGFIFSSPAFAWGLGILLAVGFCLLAVTTFFDTLIPYLCLKQCSFSIPKTLDVFVAFKTTQNRVAMMKNMQKAKGTLDPMMDLNSYNISWPLFYSKHDKKSSIGFWINRIAASVALCLGGICAIIIIPLVKAILWMVTIPFIAELIGIFVWLIVFFVVDTVIAFLVGRIWNDKERRDAILEQWSRGELCFENGEAVPNGRASQEQER